MTMKQLSIWVQDVDAARLKDHKDMATANRMAFGASKEDFGKFLKIGD